MSSKAGELIRRAERGERIAAIREALGMSGDAFAAAVNARSPSGVTLDYDKSKVSRLESGGVAYFTAEEAVVIAALDPERRGIDWLVFGTSVGRRQREPRERRVG